MKVTTRTILAASVISPILALFIGGGFLFLQAKICQLAPPNTFISVDHIDSKRNIFFDAAIDDNQTIHLIWQSTESGLSYQNSPDLGQTWTEPVVIFPKPVEGLSLEYSKYDRSLKPQIIAYGSTISVYWSFSGLNQRLSTDGGITWGKQRKIFNQGSPVLSHNDSLLYIVYCTPEGIYFARSGDWGSKWELPLLISSITAKGHYIEGPSVAINKDVIYVVWSYRWPDKSGQIQKSINKLYYAQGFNAGENWGDIQEIDVSKVGKISGSIPPVKEPIISTQGRNLLIAFRKGTLNVIASDDGGKTWPWHREISDVPVDKISVSPNSGEGIYIFWVDERHQAKEWWGYIPLHFIISWDADPYKHNNDLYYALVEKNLIKKTGRLTPPLSFVDTYPSNTIMSTQLRNSIVVFWSGKRKVEKYAITSKMPYEIFYRIFDGDNEIQLN